MKCVIVYNSPLGAQVLCHRAFDHFVHEGHDIVQDVMKHFSVRLEAPININSRASKLEGSFAIDTIVFQTKKCRQAIIIIEFSHRQYASTDNNTSPSYPESSCPGLSGSPLI
ncbi:unnamed protein product [Rhizophagus irregularis]|nr:unnamed protein product [Rhizophagus irregularis]CAB5388862.1 unnamed protein product [Rhizophagus irregularis]